MSGVCRSDGWKQRNGASTDVPRLRSLTSAVIGGIAQDDILHIAQIRATVPGLPGSARALLEFRTAVGPELVLDVGGKRGIAAADNF